MVSDTKMLTCFPIISLCKTRDPGAGAFLYKDHNLNKFGIGPPDDTLYQISRA